MNIERFFTHHGIVENPFRAEEARHDPVFERLIRTNQSHPDFEKILGQIDRPSTSVVFGEKGSGKTAIRLQIGRRVGQHNRDHSDRRAMLVAYDDLNPFLDRIAQRRSSQLGFHRASKAPPEELLEQFRLEDHQDAILSLAVTQLNDALLDGSTERQTTPLPENVEKRMKHEVPRSVRGDWAVLSALYDQPRGGNVASRWSKLRHKLRLGWQLPVPLSRLGATVLSVIAIALWAMTFFVEDRVTALQISAALCAAAAVLLWGVWLVAHARLWRLANRLRREMPAIERQRSDLRMMLIDLRTSDLAGMPFPTPPKRADKDAGDRDSRYQLTRRFLRVLESLGYTGGMMVLIDRIDEPQLVSGKAERMRSIVWPMFDNKFLQQEGVGLKLLLPLELRHLLRRESGDFFQEARLDKQNLIDRLDWSGATLYDLCTARLRACHRSVVEGPAEVAQTQTAEEGESAGEPEKPHEQHDSEQPTIRLTDLFEDDVTREMLIDALDQMHQPRDAFKFLYSVIQEHCRMVPEDASNFQIPRLVLEGVRRQQAQRVQELYRGLSPA